MPASLQYTIIPPTHQSTNHQDVSHKQQGPFYSDACNIGCVCLQKTHRAPHLEKTKITGMALIAVRPHIKHGSAILIRSDMQVKSVSGWEQDNVELRCMEKFVLPALGHGNLPHIVTGDFNGHSTTWGYTDANGEAVEQCADSCNLTLIHNAKLSKSFNSARWKRGYSPDLICVSESIANMCGKSVIEPIPHTKHRPICAHANPIVVSHSTPFRRHFNLRKADWNGYST